MDLEDFLRRQAQQILELARKAADPELRRRLEELAHACVSELDAIKRKETLGENRH
jgi:cell division septum initiation protein DivIVA